ncbi:hypothetical protein KCV01_g14166, partial [Aureobasidium melanogenum]
MTAPNRLIFNFSSEPAPDNHIRKKAATPRRKRAEVLESPAIVVDEDRSPLFEPLSENTPYQIDTILQADDASKAADMSTNAKTNRRADPSRTPARTSVSGRSSQVRGSTYQSISQTPFRPDAITYHDGDSVSREIWQPGDGNGVRDSEFPGKQLFKERYRFFQSDIGSIGRGANSPPHFVALDDKAIWDIVTSKKYTAKERGTYWPLDFMSNGTLRAGRRHKGRAAVVANESQGHVEGGDNQRVGSIPWVKAGSKPNVINYQTIISWEKTVATKKLFSALIQAQLVPRTRGQHPEQIITAAIKQKYAAKRKADQPLNPRHDRPKVVAQNGLLRQELVERPSMHAMTMTKKNLNGSMVVS